MPVCTGAEPPECCQPAPLSAAEWEARGWRLAAIRATLPTRCPQCGSGIIWPLWRDDFDGWMCADCRRVFAERD
jgi:uncharacterized protein (DUF983 family)